ncbi:right-handed parallel beta-helix repeat-containing protein [Amycolatopsis acidiphila]|uniref:Right-handed parallel beta-helix repeat-containing protein n=1 Tax=Amycolatopsis acidiphila TaxID=715473 RepID=A0A558A5S1_9PSEU|nr:right-handed parallel beta-helix repeat-containing protein [Amycolatopsis acidiphila]TVT19600.1 right-handed parallel beta-helix repeat-containing protein [Amycolatopsis acidiphila]UIJ60576.1 right-handed parallel beta-helix repeat-containing protein [Amycolatopsis acidiphila]GHG82024.1 lipoprotein [Amycolatopsis acidiphila]
MKIRWALLGVLSPLLLVACSPSTTQDKPSAAAAAAPASASTAAVCDKERAGPAAAPAGAVAVDPNVVGDLIAKTKAGPAGTTFWLAPGTHRLGSGNYDQVMPKDGDVYVGAPGAIVDGGHVNQYAFTGHAQNVRIQHLTVQDFDAPHDEGVVNHDSGDGWVIEDNTVQHNSGAALMAGARQQVIGNCLRENGQYGMNAYKGDGTITGLVVQGNEIAGNNTDDWETKSPGCGCSGGIKFWAVNGADVRGNWVHDNRGVALWADTNNNDFLIEGNVIENNDSAAIEYETSYNATIRDNTIRRNNWVDGRKYADRGDSFPIATIYISESGGEPRVPARTASLDIEGNVLQDNWSGITLWENADRFCNSPANTSSGTCTLVQPDAAKCAQPGIATEPLYSDCRWKTKNVDIHDNRFELDPAVVNCQVTCGRMALLSNYGTYPDWSPYQGDVVQEAITSNQHNQWHDNTYSGPWTFVSSDTSQILDSFQWQGAQQQDQGSTFTKGG